MSSTIYLPPLQKKSTVKHCSKIAQQAPLVTVGKAKCFNSFQTVKKTVRDGAEQNGLIREKQVICSGELIRYVKEKTYKARRKVGSD